MTQLITELRKKIAVVTGACGGIGKAIDIVFASKGVELCLIGRDLDKLKNALSLPRTAQVNDIYITPLHMV